jgi:type 1 fimbriae regulatory protein FimB/type 1 fimbriae regulatory protein FimE
METAGTKPARPANADLRSRQYLTPAEVEKLIKTAKDGHYGHRDGPLILIAFRHGPRPPACLAQSAPFWA